MTQSVPEPDPREERLDVYDRAKEFTSIIAVDTLSGAKFLVSTADNTVGRLLFLKGNRGEFGVLESAFHAIDSLGLRPRVEGKTFVDIGANIGTSTIAALLWHPFHDAVAFEPEPGNYKLLKLNAVLNDVDDRLRTVPIAVSNESGTATLLLNPFNSGGHAVRIGRSQPFGIVERPGKMTVEKVSLDDLVTRDLLDPDRIGMIWIDVQGHEGMVLSGGRSVFAAGIPTVIEFYPRMLKGAAQWRMLNRMVASYFTHFVDLREIQREGQDFELRDARALAAFGSAFEERRFTDLLLVRLPA
jgi:FkbM family methyltransferase